MIGKKKKEVKRVMNGRRFLVTNGSDSGGVAHEFIEEARGHVENFIVKVDFAQSEQRPYDLFPKAPIVVYNRLERGAHPHECQRPLYNCPVGPAIHLVLVVCPVDEANHGRHDANLDQRYL